MSQPPPANEGKALGWLNAVKGLTLTNVLVIVLLAVVAVPVYVIYRALDDEKLLDRFMSTYEEKPAASSMAARCAMCRRVAGRTCGASRPDLRFQGADRWAISVIAQP